MCGIAGTIDLRGRRVPQTHLRAMGQAVAHRGPDDDGIYQRRNVGLAFRRLAIIDLSPAGHQPMFNRDRSLVIIFNGEIFNYRELTAKLKRKGYRFQSQSDTEAILHAYAEYGANCVDHLNGMFAFVIHDVKKHLLFCARDRFGIKPFYYTLNEKRFAFGSEIKAILKLPDVRKAVDLDALNEYFSFQNVFSDHTLFRNIFVLPPGHIMTVSEDGRLEKQEYWDPVPQPDRSLTHHQAVEQVREVFQQAVERHMIADVPVGSQLSGGLDSAAIVSAAAKKTRFFKTFTGGFDVELSKGLEMNFDERPDAEIVAQANQTEHYSMIIRPGDMERILPKLIWHQEDLRVGNSYPTYFINELGSKFVKVLHSGTGGDELFGGYAWRYQLIHDAKKPEVFDQRFLKYWTRLLDDSQRQRLFQPAILRHLTMEGPRASYRTVVDRHTHLSPVNKALYFEMKTFLHGLLTVEDKVSAAHSIESRVPFLDLELVNLALRIPPEWKVKGLTGKVIFRQAIKPLLPPALLKKKKQGFSAPEHLWFRRSLKQYVHTVLLSKHSMNRHFFKPSVVEDIIQQHMRGTNHRLLIWSLLSFEWWLRLYMDHISGPEEAVNPVSFTK